MARQRNNNDYVPQPYGAYAPRVNYIYIGINSQQETTSVSMHQILIHTSTPLIKINDSHPLSSVVATPLPVLGVSVTALQESHPAVGTKAGVYSFENMKEDYDK